jgi:hypothetical protein
MSEFSSEWKSVQYLAAILAVVVEIGKQQGLPEQQLLDALNEAAINP